MVDGVEYQNLGGHKPDIYTTAGSICAAQIVVDLAQLIHVATYVNSAAQVWLSNGLVDAWIYGRFVRRISLRVAFTFLFGSILSFAFYYEFMDMVLRVNANTSAFMDLHTTNPCTFAQNMFQVCS